jgi:chromosome partitioning protein
VVWARPPPPSTSPQLSPTKGFKTLLIDLDPQANSTMSYVDPHGWNASMYDVLVSEELGIRDVIVPTPVENLWLAPSRIAWRSSSRS